MCREKLKYLVLEIQCQCEQKKKQVKIVLNAKKFDTSQTFQLKKQFFFPSNNGEENVFYL